MGVAILPSRMLEYFAFYWQRYWVHFMGGGELGLNGSQLVSKETGWEHEAPDLYPVGTEREGHIWETLWK